MGLGTRIEWTEATWNPVTGCTKVSPGCEHCYAERFAARLQRMGYAHYVNGFAPAVHPDALEIPLSWRRPRLVFVVSMGDLFHAAVPLEFIARVFSVMARARRHTFQVLTKRVQRLAKLAPRLPFPDNVWVGASVEDGRFGDRVADLRRVPAAVRFLSLEPLLGPVPRLPLQGIHWVIVGGESGPRSRPMEVEWVRQVRDRCLASGVPFFFKQWGGPNRRTAGRELDGRVWDEMPISPSERVAPPGGRTSTGVVPLLGVGAAREGGSCPD